MARRLEEVCAETLQCGRDLATLLAGPEPGSPDRAEQLEIMLARRDALLGELKDLLEGAPAPEPLHGDLAEIVTQQRALEAAVRQQIDLLGQAVRGQQAARANVDSFRKMLNPGTQSRMLDQKR